ncbi:MAG: DUF5777 family beta-barrel protein [Gemmatimonadetes bacterium]|nr:DUF5777 family beta-barrel protein [Gemmatimonadota bacterium]MDA1102762.1 DUF5777 family beta-barrel protein [Gemmatimonadota bacterium]
MTLRSSVFASFALVTLVVTPSDSRAQEIFHSTQSANLPTAEMLRGGNWLFEISHRFLPTISDGAGELWGFDGPVYNRFGLTFAPSDRVMLGVLRTNYDDNLELNVKAALLDGGATGLRYKVAAMAGIAWNTSVDETPGFPGLRANEAQSYGQLMANVLLGERAAIGVVPTLLHNPEILDTESENAFVLGVHGQAYLTSAMSVLAEWVFSEGRLGMENGSGTFGIELETRGHFFKIVVSNQSRMNPTQFLGGTPNEFGLDELRVGFNLTRLLPF